MKTSMSETLKVKLYEVSENFEYGKRLQQDNMQPEMIETDAI